VTTVLMYAGIMVGGPLIGFGWMLFFMEFLPALVDAVRLAVRAARTVITVTSWIACALWLLLR
jgi:hypothetical protein